MDDHRDVHSAFVGVLLVPLEWSVAALSPTPWIVAMAMRAANVVNLADEIIW